MRDKRFAHDICLLAVIAALALAVFAVSLICRRDGEAVEVRVGGELYANLSLRADTVLDIDGLCLLIIENGEAYISEAICRNQICVRHRPISRSGEAIVCLPNGVTVRITGGEADFYI